MALTAEEKNIVDQFFASRLTPPSAFSPTAPSAPAPISTPPDPNTRLKAVGNLANTLISGEAFLKALPLGLDDQSFEEMPGLARFAVDNLLSPVGVASLIAAPFTGGASVAGKLGLGAAYKAAPAGVRLAGEVGARVGSDLLISGLATGGAKLAAEALPEDAPPWVKFAVPVAAGLGTGVAGGRALTKALDDPQVLAKVIQGGKYAPELPSGAEMMSRVKTFNDTGLANAPEVVKSSIAGVTDLINPSMSHASDIEKHLTAINNYKIIAENNVKHSLALLYPSNANVIETREGLFKGTPWRNFYSLGGDTPAEKTQIQRFNDVMGEYRQKLTSYLPESKNIESHVYVPVMDKRGRYIKPTDPADRKVWDKLQEYAARGDVDINNPEVIARATMEAAFDAEIDSKVKSLLVDITFSPDDIVYATPEGKALVDRWQQAVKDKAAAQAGLEKAGRLGKASNAARKNAVDTATTRLNEARQELQDMLYPSSGAIANKKGGEMAVQTALPGLGAPLSTFNLPVVPKKPNTTRMLESEAKKAITSLKRELKATPYRTNAAKVLRSNIEDAADVRAHLGARMDIEARIYQLEEGLKKVEDQKAQVALARLTNTTPVDVFKANLKEAKAREQAAYKEIKTYKENLGPVKVPYGAFGLDKAGEGVAVPYKGRYLLDGEDQVKKVEQWIEQRRISAPGNVLSTFQSINDAGRYVQSALDMGGAFTVYLPMFFRDPVTWSKALTKSWQAMLDPKWQIRYLSAPENQAAIRQMIFNGVPIGDIEATISAQRGGALNALTRGPGKQVFGRLQTAFETGVQVARVEAWKSMSKLPQYQGQERQLARMIRNLTNGLEPRSLGVSGKQQALESIIFFSPRLMRSSISLVGSAMRPWSPEGADAAQVLLRATSSVGALFMLANYASGVLDGKTDAEIWKNMEDTANPLKGRQFMSVQVGDEWYGIGGTVRAILQTLGRQIGDSTGDSVSRGNNPASDFFQGRLAPFPRMMLGYAEYQTGGKKDFLPFENIEDLADMTRFTVKGALPFYLQDYAETLLGGQQNFDTNAKIPLEFAGIRVSPTTASDVLNNESYRRYNRSFANLTGVEQEDIKSSYPDLVKDAETKNSYEERQYKAEVKRIDDETTQKLLDLNTLLKEGRFTLSDFRDEVDTAMRDRWVTQAENRQVRGIIYDTPADSDKRAVLDAYYRTFDPISQGGAELVKGTMDWDLWEQKQAELKQEIAAGTFGDPKRAQQYLDERSRFELPSELQWYQDAKDVISASGYYDIRGEAFEQYRSVITRLVPEAQSASDLDILLNSAAASNDMAAVARISKAKQFLDKIDRAGKERLEGAHPEVKKALFLLGRSNSPNITRR